MSKSPLHNLHGKESAEKYRRSDEEEVLTDHHARLCTGLRDLSRSFGREITALDLGCGTGRYFHCLEQVSLLTGVDLAPHMLEQAQCPVRQEEVTVARIETICGDLLEVRFPPQSFDLIYSLGVLGEMCPFGVELCDRLYDWLKPGGKLFFSIVDITSKLGGKSLKRRVAEAVIPFLPASIQQQVTRRFSTHYLTEQQLLTVMKTSKFTSYKVHRKVTNALYWSGAHFECLAHKGL